MHTKISWNQETIHTYTQLKGLAWLVRTKMASKDFFSRELRLCISSFQSHNKMYKILTWQCGKLKSWTRYRGEKNRLALLDSLYSLHGQFFYCRWRRENVICVLRTTPSLSPLATKYFSFPFQLIVKADRTLARGNLENIPTLDAIMNFQFREQN